MPGLGRRCLRGVEEALLPLRHPEVACATRRAGHGCAVALSFLVWLVASPCRGGVHSAIKLNHFGYRPSDKKVAVVTQDPGGAAEIRRSDNGAVVFTVPVDGGSISDSGFDAQAGDDVWRVDFSSFTEPGEYCLSVPALGGESSPFEIDDDAYGPLLAALLKAMYAQRCGTAHPAGHMGAEWADGSECHMQDAACTRNVWDQGAGPDYGALDLTGGWHDAGDYNKYIGAAAPFNGDSGDAIWFLATAYDLNPGAFADDQAGIPESGNGVPDVLDEIRWGLDWYLKMQRSDGSVLSIVHARAGVYTSASPPSADPTERYYMDANTDSTAIAAACFAIGAREFAGIDATYSGALRAAAEEAWAWLDGQHAESKLWAAAELARTAPSGTLAAECRAYVDGYAAWDTADDMWSEGCKYGATDYGVFAVRAMAAYVQAAGATASTVSGVRNQLSNLTDSSFAIAGHYGSGLRSWEYYWSSNRVKAIRGLLLVLASEIGATGGHTPAETRAQAGWYLHYLCGVNAMNMVHASNMSSVGGEHSVWRIYHAWFPYGHADYYGKPAGVVEPGYPYFGGTDELGISDDVASTYGPFPGMVPDGPNQNYPQGGSGVTPPKGASAPHRFYRDWAYVDPAGNVSVPWEVNETGIYYIASFAALAAQFVELPQPQPETTGCGCSAQPVDPHGSDDSLAAAVCAALLLAAVVRRTIPA